MQHGATEPSEARAEVAGPPPPAADGYMYVCEAPGAARYECAFEPAPHMEQPFDEHMFGEFGKERHVAVVVGDIGELYRDELPAFAPEHKRKDEPLLLQAAEPSAPHAPHPPPPPPPAKKSDKKKSDNNGIKKKKTR